MGRGARNAGDRRERPEARTERRRSETPGAEQRLRASNPQQRAQKPEAARTRPAEAEPAVRVAPAAQAAEGAASAAERPPFEADGAEAAAVSAARRSFPPPAARASEAPADYGENGPESYPDFDEEVPELGIGTRVVPPHLRFDSEAEGVVPSSTRPSSSSPPPEPSGDLEAQIRALEARLDGLIRRAGLSDIDVSPSGSRSSAPAAAEPEPLASRPPAAPPAAVAAKYVARQWSREALRSRFEEIDDFGLDPAFEARVRPVLDLLYRRYFRVQVEGLEHVPSSGAAVIVANHSGTLPLDGAMLRTAIRLDHPSGRDLRWLTEDFVFYLPFAGVVLNRIGAVRACPENAERLLEQDALVAVFPEGLHGIKKLFRERYRLQRFGRGGFIRLCLRTRAPLVPCAIVGAEEANPLLYRIDWLAEIVKLPYLPITPTFPLLGPLGLMPAPTRWKIRFGEPISFDHYGPEAADDHVLVGTLSDRVRSSIQTLIDGSLRARKSIWFG
nr:MAG: acyl-phosphate glycerol 3-phosphate acyltransferase [Pseudomonadota bacterium]